MLPLIPFAVGILTGVAAVKLVRNEKAKKGLECAQERLQNATVSSLAAIELSSARLRQRLQAAQARTQSLQAAGHKGLASTGRTLGALFPQEAHDTYGALGQSPAARALGKAYR